MRGQATLSEDGRTYSLAACPGDTVPLECGFAPGGLGARWRSVGGAVGGPPACLALGTAALLACENRTAPDFEYATALVPGAKGMCDAGYSMVSCSCFSDGGACAAVDRGVVIAYGLAASGVCSMPGGAARAGGVRLALLCRRRDFCAEDPCNGQRCDNDVSAEGYSCSCDVGRSGPTCADADAYGCDAGWTVVGSKCFAAGDLGRYTHTSAELACNARGARLASLRNMDEVTAAQGLCNAGGAAFCAVGARSDVGIDFRWEWCARLPRVHARTLARTCITCARVRLSAGLTAGFSPPASGIPTSPTGRGTA